MYSYNGPADTQALTTPTSLLGVSTSPSVNLSWAPSVDNYSVKDYDVYQDNTFIGTTIWQKYFVDGLQPSTNYIFKVQARDYSGRVSGFATTQTTTIGAGVSIINPGFEDNASQT